ncbi:hypothetical protein CJ739_103 [Mariniflexile rhizosphaerae]|uniref:hypothetical protein n=1 Tax=unclassified Mariniflexile TaxID=2643887 RepID=UPI000E331B43|nr:hypothetical protein [Mariniflexile sp. TRM1-10]AXP79203.1 hypothetical protein CJ739_103 [Mariniflexile sp. TRM1-10]
MRDTLIPLKGVSDEIKELTAVQSLKAVLRINERLRKENKQLQDRLDIFEENPDIRGMSRKINTQKLEIENLTKQLKL